jgi:DNA polymerase I-like protein with 3'-5' exonuclease and polymerase domains
LLPQSLEGANTKIVGTVHDEILVEAPEEHAESVTQILKTTMESAGRVYLQIVPVVADVRIGLSWAEDPE